MVLAENHKDRCAQNINSDSFRCISPYMFVTSFYTICLPELSMCSFAFPIHHKKNASDNTALPLPASPSLANAPTVNEPCYLHSACSRCISNTSFAFSRTKTPVPYFIKRSRGSFYFRAYESVLTKTSSHAHPHSLSQ